MRALSIGVILATAWAAAAQAAPLGSATIRHSVTVDLADPATVTATRDDGTRLTGVPARIDRQTCVRWFVEVRGGLNAPLGLTCFATEGPVRLAFGRIISLEDATPSSAGEHHRDDQGTGQHR